MGEVSILEDLIIRGELLVWTTKADQVAKAKTKQNGLQSIYPDWFRWKLNPMISRVTSALEFDKALKLALVAIFHQPSDTFDQQSRCHSDQAKLQLLSKYMLNAYYVHCAGCQEGCQTESGTDFVLKNTQ